MTMLTELPAPFINEAGKIQNLVELTGEGACGVAIIESVKGARRSSHFHKEDWHYLYVLQGSMLYTERRVGSGTIVKVRIKQGEMIRTGPRIEHWVEFDEPTKLISISRFSRAHGQHELDVVRVPWIEEE